MKVRQLAVGGFWEQQLQEPSSPSSSSSSSSSTTSSLTIRFKRLRPLAPKLTASVAATAVAATQTIASLDVKGYNFPQTKCTAQNPDTSQVETQSGGTRWNPTPEQIGALETLYRGGMRTPNAHQIECITAELGKYGRIEGKNVFYWFQNHKARERQKQKRSALLALNGGNNDSRSNSGTCHPVMALKSTGSRGGRVGGGEAEEYHDGTCKRKCRSWGVGVGRDIVEDGGGDRTLELFPLHPEGKQTR